jgi:putative hemolysin
VVTVLSFVSLVLGELVPKSLALRAAEPYALALGRPLLALSYVARPLIWLLTSTSNLVLRLFGDETSFIESRLSPDELQQLVSEASQGSGKLHPGVGNIATRALQLGELRASEVMVPRNRVLALPVSADAAELRELLGAKMHARLPVYEDTPDRVVGYVGIKDILPAVWEGRPLVLRELMHKPFFVPETKRAVELLEEMRSRRLPFAIVVDELGAMSGIVTLEDVLEELVGDIVSEHELPAERIHFEPEGSFRVSASLPVRDVNRELGMHLPEGDWTTLAGLYLASTGHIPAVGETLHLRGGVTMEVVDASARRIRTLRLRPPAKETKAEASRVYIRRERTSESR